MGPEEISRNSAVAGRRVLAKTMGIVQHRKGKVKSAFLPLDTFSWFIVGRIISLSFYLLSIGKYTSIFFFFS